MENDSGLYPDSGWERQWWMITIRGQYEYNIDNTSIFVAGRWQALEQSYQPASQPGTGVLKNQDLTPISS